MENTMLNAIHAALESGGAIPYLGPGVLTIADQASSLPDSPETLVGKLTANSSVPHKIRKNLTAAAQFIENFKHRKTVSTAMTAAFRGEAQPTALHRYLATLPSLPLVVHAWYDDLPQKAFASRDGWGMSQGVSQAEHFGSWVHYFHADGSRATNGADAMPAAALGWRTLVYQPFGSVSPAANYLVSDSDFVEVLTEIDIQTPIPPMVQTRRLGRHFLFLGCRFATQMERMFARQIMKRSSGMHWAVLPEEPTKNEARFLVEQNVQRVDMPLSEFVEVLARKGHSSSVQ
jgi:SIR2-like domain